MNAIIPSLLLLNVSRGTKESLDMLLRRYFYRLTCYLGLSFKERDHKQKTMFHVKHEKKAAKPVDKLVNISTNKL